jgi:predicted metal-binding membrane protein
MAVLTLLAWGAMAEMARRMNDAQAAAHLQAWSVSKFFVAFGMWSVMMMGMMLPSASPMVLTFAGISRRRATDRPLLRTSLFVSGYLLVWIGYSAGAALAQGAFRTAALLSPMGASTSLPLAGGLLVIAGIYQWTPIKEACLTGCRSPMGFLMAEWRPGRRGALAMGWRHGWNCAGCCWATMTLMFVLGVMNLLWMAALTALCLIEKVAPAGDRIGRIAGIGFIGWGGWLIAHALF